MITPVVTRFAPNSTGHLRLGNVRTGLINYLVNYLAARKELKPLTKDLGQTTGHTHGPELGPLLPCIGNR